MEIGTRFLEIGRRFLQICRKTGDGVFCRVVFFFGFLFFGFSSSPVRPFLTPLFLVYSPQGPEGGRVVARRGDRFVGG
jgi:hypothetical protein